MFLPLHFCMCRSNRKFQWFLIQLATGTHFGFVTVSLDLRREWEPNTTSGRRYPTRGFEPLRSDWTDSAKSEVCFILLWFPSSRVLAGTNQPLTNALTRTGFSSEWEVYWIMFAPTTGLEPVFSPWSDRRVVLPYASHYIGIARMIICCFPCLMTLP